MKRSPLLFSLIGLFCALAGQSSLFAASPEFRILADKDSLRVGQEVRLTITATWEGHSLECLMGEVILNLPEGLEQLNVQPASQELTFKNGQPFSTFTYQCSLHPKKEGEFTLDKMELKFRLPETKAEEWETWKPPQPIVLKVAPALAISRETGIATAIVGGIVILALLVFGFATVRYRRQLKAERPADVESAFLEELSSLRSLRIKGEFKAYFADLEVLIGSYVARKYSVPAEDLETIVKTISSKLDAQTGRRLQEILKLAEDIRFGGAPPLPTDMDRAHALAKEILERSRPASAKQKPEEEIVLREA